MERAMCLLAHRGAIVTEAAFEVGYDSLSHFATTVSAHHGIKPSGVLRGALIDRPPGVVCFRSSYPFAAGQFEQVIEAEAVIRWKEPSGMRESLKVNFGSKS